MSGLEYKDAANAAARLTCPRAECQTCKLFGHVAADCAYANCLDVDVDWFNILFTKCETIVNAYFTEASIPTISLQTDGIVRPISSCDQLQDKLTLSANQLMEKKLATYNFKRDECCPVPKLMRTARSRSSTSSHKGILEPGDRRSASGFFVIKPIHTSGEKHSAL
jgi:hypothetical protein